MNWGNRLVVVFIVFGAFIGYMVYRSVTTKIDMVTKDYYNEELKYQHVIDATNNANQLEKDILVSVTGREVVIQMPMEKNIRGNILFYCPSDAKNDVRKELSTGMNGSQAFDIALFNEGQYEVKIDWEVEGKKYFSSAAMTVKR
jgi:hypothetical protein